MKSRDIDRFFRLLSREYPAQVRVYLLGGAAALLMGGSRPTLDIDFEVDLGAVGPKAWDAFDVAIKKVQDKTGILAQYSQSIERWGMITMLNYRQKAKRHKTYGRLRVFVLSPLHWSIGKIGRFLQQDCDDLIAVFSEAQPSPVAVAKLWYHALAMSPRSPEQALVKRNILYFFTRYGKKIWGKNCPLPQISSIFSPKASP